MTSSISRTLAATLQGKVYYCACRDRTSMCFKGRWFAFKQGGLPEFRRDLAGLLQDKPFMERLIEEASAQAVRAGESPESLPSLQDLDEMLELVDTALLVLEAQEIIGKA